MATTNQVTQKTDDDEAIQAARAAGLHYVGDDQPGISRRRAGRGFSYRDVDGTTIRDPAKRERIKALAIPPAWTEVWICPSKNGHIQATGRDARGRKQYLYHDRWREVRDADKFDRLAGFADALPAIREQTDADLRKHGLPREKVLAGVISLLEATLIRVGNSHYAEVNESFGLTTLRTKHVDVAGSRIHFRFRGKGGQDQEVDLVDQRLARLIKKCMEIPGYELFQYVDSDGNRNSIESGDVNRYLRQITKQEFTAKDFRTWGGTLLAASELAQRPVPDSEPDITSAINEAIKTVAGHLGNTPQICRKCYVHPGVLEAFRDGTLKNTFARTNNARSAAKPYELDAAERATLVVIKRYPAEQWIANL